MSKVGLKRRDALDRAEDFLTLEDNRDFKAGKRIEDALSKDDQNQKKADVVERPKAFHHVGLLVNEPPGTAGLLFM